MNKTGRISLLLRVLARIAQSQCSVADLTLLTGISRTALFRLLAMARKELHVELIAVRGVGYTLVNWGVLDGAQVAKHYGEESKKWTGKKRSPR